MIPLSEEDQKEILHQANGRRDKTGLILLGFKPKGTIPSYHTMAPAYFIYPNDEVVKGSREAFVELHSAMLRKNVVAIGEVIFRLNWEAKLVLIYPVEEVFEELTDDPENLRQKRPPGMAVVELPFEDDMRALEIDEIIQDFEMTLGSRDTKIEDVTIKSEGTNKLGPEAVTSAGSLVENGCSVASEELVTAAMELVDRLKVDEGMELGEDFAVSQNATSIPIV